MVSCRHKLKLALTASFLALTITSCGPEGAVPKTALPGVANAVSDVTVAIPQGAVGQGPAAYGTNPLVIPAGTKVTWTNNDTVPHTATSDTGAFDSGTLNPGQSFSFTFNNPGTFPYHCTIHGAQSMSGTIEVTAASPTPTTTAAPAPTGTATPTPLVSVSPTPLPSQSQTPLASIPVTSGKQGQQQQ